MKRYNLDTILNSCQVLGIAWQLEFFMSKTEAATVMYCHPNINVPNNADMIIKSRRQVGYLFHFKNNFVCKYGLLVVCEFVYCELMCVQSDLKLKKKVIT